MSPCFMVGVFTHGLVGLARVHMGNLFPEFPWCPVQRVLDSARV